jgi:hypothetical protein
MAREILSKRNFLDFQSPDSAISRSPMTLMKSIVSLHQGPKVSKAKHYLKTPLDLNNINYLCHALIPSSTIIHYNMIYRIHIT